MSDGPAAPRARIVGALYCRSPHGCPVCSGRARETAREQLREMVGFWRTAHGDVHLLTLTIRHRRGHALATMLDILSVAWDYVIRRAAWRRSMASLGLGGHCHVLEPTYGANGWHAHVHALLLTNASGARPASARDLNGVVRALREQWLAALEHAFDSLEITPEQRAQYRPSAHQAVRMTVPGVGDYLVKATAPSLDALAPQAGMRTVQEIMQQAALGNRHAQRLWAEYTAAMHRRKLVPGLGHLRRKLGIAAPAPAAAPRAERLVACVPAPDYNQLARSPEVLAEICREAVALGCRGVAIVAARVLHNVRTWFLRRVPETVRELERRFDPARDPSRERRERIARDCDRMRRHRCRCIALAVHRARALQA